MPLLAIRSVLGFAIWRSEQRSTRIFLTCALLLNLAGPG
jgi:hypothetical protein